MELAVSNFFESLSGHLELLFSGPKIVRIIKSLPLDFYIGAVKAFGNDQDARNLPYGKSSIRVAIGRINLR